MLIFKEYKIEGGELSFKINYNDRYYNVSFTLNNKGFFNNNSIRYVIKALASCLRYKEEPEIRFDLGENETIERPDKLSISVSGGLDSMAVNALFPDIPSTYMGYYEPQSKLINPDYSIAYEDNDFLLKGKNSMYYSIPAFVYNLGNCNIVCNTLEIAYNLKYYLEPPAKIEYGGFEAGIFVKGLTAAGTALIGSKLLGNEKFAAAKKSSNFEIRNNYKELCARVIGGTCIKDGELEIGQVRYLKNYYIFLVPYVIKKLGLDEAKKCFSDIPASLIDLADLNLDFYTKYNSAYVETIPKSIRKEFLKKLSSLGIEVYNDTDLKELAAVKETMETLIHKWRH